LSIVFLLSSLPFLAILGFFLWVGFKVAKHFFKFALYGFLFIILILLALGGLQN